MKLISDFFLTVFRGIGQIMLQENPITGVFFLVGLFYGSVYYGFAALVSVICGTITAYIFRFDKQTITTGFYGFSAALVGVALLVFLKNNAFTWFFIVVGSMLATIVQHFFFIKKIGVFTLPFVLVTWVICYGTTAFFPNQLALSSIYNETKIDYFTFAFKGYGQVIFQDKLLSGILFFIGVLVNNWRVAILGLLASVISAIISLFFYGNVLDFNMGLLGYNAVLCAIALSTAQKNYLFWIFISILIAIFFSYLFHQIHFIALTFPFVISTMVVLKFKNKESII
ncbi:MAG: urea transporter [Bacteroidetes bacterium]|nr:urea transporter [Bacteroidota bacterium]